MNKKKIPAKHLVLLLGILSLEIIAILFSNNAQHFALMKKMIGWQTNRSQGIALGVNPIPDGSREEGDKSDELWEQAYYKFLDEQYINDRFEPHYHLVRDADHFIRVTSEDFVLEAKSEWKIGPDLLERPVDTDSSVMNYGSLSINAKPFPQETTEEIKEEEEEEEEASRGFPLEEYAALVSDKQVQMHVLSYPRPEQTSLATIAHNKTQLSQNEKHVFEMFIKNIGAYQVYRVQVQCATTCDAEGFPQTRTVYFIDTGTRIFQFDIRALTSNNTKSLFQKAEEVIRTFALQNP